MQEDNYWNNQSYNKNKLNERAVFSDGTQAFRTPAEPMPGDVVEIRLRTAVNNADEVYLCLTEEKINMQKATSDSLFDYYQCRIAVSTEKIAYLFLIKNGGEDYYYTQAGVTREPLEQYRFFIIPGYKTPDWAKGAVFYQILVDRFYNGDGTNDVLDDEYIYVGDKTRRITDWGKYPDKLGVREFYGGDLLGVMRKLDYLEELGIEAIYLNPIFVSPSNHKYDIQDYDYVDPHLGRIVVDEGECLKESDQSNVHAGRYICRVTRKENLEASNELFAELVEEAHKRGIKVILDGVFNHCGSFNKWMDREEIYRMSGAYADGAYISSDSPYRNFFRFSNENWPNNTSYEGWWGYDTLPKLNYESSMELYEYILDVAKKWVSPPYNADGWRLDVAADLSHSAEFNHKFFKDFRKAVKTAKPDAIILAEHYGDPFSWLQGGEWDTIMNYDAFMEPISWFLTGMEKHSDEYRGHMLCNTDAFQGAMVNAMSRMYTSSMQTAMNELSNHDHSRFLTRTNRKVGRTSTLGPEAASQDLNPAVMREAVVFQMTWPGAPTIYYGDEAGVCGFTDPDNRRTYPWGKEDKEMIRMHKELIRLRRSYEALRTGSLKLLESQNGVLQYGRFNEKDKFVIIINNNSYGVELYVPVWEIGITDGEPLVRMAYTNEGGFGVDTITYRAEGGRLTISLSPYASLILKNLPDIF